MRVRCQLAMVALMSVACAWAACQKERPARPSDSPASTSMGSNAQVVAVAPPPVKAPSEASPAQLPSKTPPPPTRGARVQDLSVEEFEALVVAVAVCEVGPRGISRSCEPYQAYRNALRWRGPISRPWREVDRELATRLLGHEDAAVRYTGAELMGPLLQASFEQLRPLVEATRREVHPGVVKSFVKRLGPSTYRHQEVRELMMVLGGHLDERVRIEVGNWLTSAQGRGTPGILERAMRMVREDPSERVRLRVLDDLGDSADARVLPFLEPYLEDAEKSPRAHASAVRALINMWSSPIPKASPSREAYQRTLTLLNATPRSEESPPWAAIGGLRWVVEPRFVAAASWFDRTALVTALEGLITDQAANEKARTASVELLIRYEEPRSRFSKLLARCLREGEKQGAVVELLRAATDPKATALTPGPTRVPLPGLPIPSAPNASSPPPTP